MNVFANILRILIILFFVAIAAAFILLGVMVIFPGFTLFGLHYVSGDGKVSNFYYDTVNDTFYSKEPNIEASEIENGQWSKVSKVLIETNGWDVSVRAISAADRPQYDEGFNIYVSRNFRGFATNDVAEPKFSGFTFEQRADGFYLIMKMTEPTGLLSRSKTEVSVVVNENLLENRDLIISTNSGSVSIGNAYHTDVPNLNYPTKFKSLDITSLSGRVSVADVFVKDAISVNKDSGDVTFYKDLTADTMLKITKGFGKVILGNVGTSTSPKHLNLEEIYNTQLKFNTVYGDLYVTGKAGYIEGNYVAKSMLVETDYCDVFVDKIDSSATFNNKEGSINIKDANSSVTAYITNGNGGISITNLYGVSDLKTDKGSIYIENVYADLKVNSNSGKITLNNAEESIVKYTIQTVNSEVSISNIMGSVNMITDDKGRAKVNATYKRIVGANSFITHSGAIDIKFLQAGHTFWLKDWSTANKVYIKLSGLTEEKINKSSDSDSYKNGVKIGGYTGTSDYLSVNSVSGAVKIYQDVSV